MANYEEVQRYHCQGRSGRNYVVIEQMKTSGAGYRLTTRPAKDYMTADGDVAERLDDENFLLLLSDEVVHIERTIPPSKSKKRRPAKKQRHTAATTKDDLPREL
ncbi:hypothetical protein [Rhizobium sp. BK251]|uniref:hypothetical protein n=1 Tax=Rhizobium sp. BK251 TaxID=2512125 RepID=UPI0010E220C9|nr:hypothetical protein [Rhizobium sp. BK251]TCL71990.1 hypothetical protein EV286_105248 [Rhizobium sp. BK251]